tara:strand:- start:173 stop:406 length:234 start_codon:yes stop_codon:yes gene_type:complete
MNKNTSITKQINLKDYRHWQELYNITRELLDDLRVFRAETKSDTVTLQTSYDHSWALSHLSDFSNSILKDLEKLEQK